MASTTAVNCSYLPTKFTSPHKTASLPPILISTNSLHVNPHHLRKLYTLCHHSCHRFPVIDATGNVEPLDLLKLQTAISHSSIVVSAFVKSENVMADIGGEWIKKVVPVTPENGLLIGFGRAVTDFALTSSIYDVMVHPALQRRGIGRRIVQRIIRMLTNKGIYDIAAMCTDTERQFFSRCGFGEDILGSTTMMYARAPSRYSEDQQIVSAGRMSLLVPHPKEFSI